MKIEFNKRITVLCDCTENEDLRKYLLDFQQDYNETTKITFVDRKALRAHDAMIEAVKVAVDKKDSKHIIVLSTAHQVMMLSTIIANGLLDEHLEEYPVIDNKEIDVLDVYDNETVSMLDADGFLRSSGLDAAMQIIMGDYIRLQQLNRPAGPHVELGGEDGDSCVEIGDCEEKMADHVQIIGDAYDQVESAADVIRQRRKEQQEQKSDEKVC